MAASYPEARPVLRNQPPFEAVRLRDLSVYGNDMLATEIHTFAVELAAHPSLRKLAFGFAQLDSPLALDAIVDAALTLRLTKLEIAYCRMGPASAVLLPRLLRGDAWRHLTLRSGEGYGTLLDARAAALLANALRSNHTLTSLAVHDVGLWHDFEAAATLLGGLVGHASLTNITLSEGRPGVAAVAIVGPQFGALVAANAPHLCVLDICGLETLSDVGMGPLVDALPRNTHLRELRCRGNTMSAAFMRNRLMPALAANTSLQKLDSGFAEANAFVAARTAAAARS